MNGYFGDGGNLRFSYYSANSTYGQIGLSAGGGGQTTRPAAWTDGCYSNGDCHQNQFYPPSCHFDDGQHIPYPRLSYGATAESRYFPPVAVWKVDATVGLVNNNLWFQFGSMDTANFRLSGGGDYAQTYPSIPITAIIGPVMGIHKPGGIASSGYGGTTAIGSNPSWLSFTEVVLSHQVGLIHQMLLA